jgi:RNA polymerase sigma-70 factor, ECF subfamily
VGEPTVVGTEGSGGFLDFYDEALPHVYGYLVRRCSTTAEAEDLTADTFLVAVDAARRGEPIAAHLPWVMGVARHKLIDHWRREARQERRLHLVGARSPSNPTPLSPDDCGRGSAAPSTSRKESPCPTSPPTSSRRPPGR